MNWFTKIIPQRMQTSLQRSKEIWERVAQAAILFSRRKP